MKMTHEANRTSECAVQWFSKCDPRAPQGFPKTFSKDLQIKTISIIIVRHYLLSLF